MSCYEDWLSLYNPEMENIVSSKIKVLRSLELLIYAFDKQVSGIKTGLHAEYKTVKLHIQSQNEKENKPVPIHLNTKAVKSPNVKAMARSTTTDFVKPKTLRLKKSPEDLKQGIKALPKDSPDIFNQSTVFNALDENVHVSDGETIPISPEVFSPRIKKKRSFRSNKFKELQKQSRKHAMNHVKQSTPDTNESKLIDTQLHLDDMIQSTPDVTYSSKNKTSSHISAKKKLFEKGTSKASLSMYTLTQLYKNQKDKNDSKTKSTIPNKELLMNWTGDDSNGTYKSQNSMLNVDELLKGVEEESISGNETEICNMIEAQSKNIKCRACNMKSSPCRKHMKPIKLREPDDTFTGFWNLDFSINTKKAKSNNNESNKDFLTQESIIYG